VKVAQGFKVETRVPERLNEIQSYWRYLINENISRPVILLDHDLLKDMSWFDEMQSSNICNAKI
jgi:hypothetical protein